LSSAADQVQGVNRPGLLDRARLARNRCEIMMMWPLPLLLGVALSAPPLVAPGDPRSPAEEQAALRLPHGFVAQLVAAEPTIRKPMNLAFDARGRLWVTDTIEYPFPAQGRPGRDRLLVLDQFTPEGKAGRATVFAEGLNIPIGVLPLPDGRSALVHTIPEVVKLTDTNGNGQADRREVILTGIGSRDTHGMVNSFTLGFDGWVYACHGFANESTIRDRAGHSITIQSGHTFRFRPDGSNLEVFTYGQVNPFGLAFDPWGDLYSADCHSRPLMLLLRGGRYPSFGKPHDGLGFAPEIMTHGHDSTGICGPALYHADQFPPAFQGRMFVCNVVTNRLNSDRLDWQGASPKAIEQPDFLTSDDPWFRPVYLQVGPEGGLYVGDFYNRIIGHYEVPLTHPGRDRERGRIWRIVHTGRPAPPPNQRPIGSIDDLAHPNLMVRLAATHQLIERGDAETVRRAFDQPVTAEQKVHVLWVLQRLDRLTDADLSACFRDASALVRVHAARVAGSRSQLTDIVRTQLRERLTDSEARVRRAAADALGRHASADDADAKALLALIAHTPATDPQLRHTALMALRDHLASRTTTPSVSSAADASIWGRAALGWPTERSARFLAELLRAFPDAGLDRAASLEFIARYWPEPKAILSLADRDAVVSRALILEAIARGRKQGGHGPLAELEEASATVIRQLLTSSDPQLIAQGISLASASAKGRVDPELQALALNRQAPESARLTAFDLLGPRLPSPVLAARLADPAEAVAIRDKVAGQLGRIDRPEPRDALAAAFSTAPARLATPIALALAQTPAGGERLLALVASGKTSAAVLTDKAVRAALAKHRGPQWNEQIDKLTRGLPSPDEALQTLIRTTRDQFDPRKADPAAGAKLFTTHCASCHTIGNSGGKVGPQLDGVGVRGVERLLEDLFDPHRNVDAEFRATVLALTNGQVLTGLVLREEGALVVIADAAGKEHRISKDEIDQRTRSPLSPMPADLARRIAPDDVHHLLAYLLAQQPVAKP
jgi:putative heme-binding domain-containing protein